MRKILGQLFLVLFCATILSCNSEGTIVKIQQPYQEVHIHSIDDLIILFKKHNYTAEDWNAGNRAVPRIIFDAVHKRWKKSSNHMPVKQKKSVFFHLMTPLILMSNENILKEQNIVKSALLNSTELLAIAVKYRVIKKHENSITEEKRQQLIVRVDIIPPSLALAQAAEESGWGTSRFTKEGNAFFGQWDFSGKGMTPNQQRKSLGNYGLARFDSPLASVEGYMLNINTTLAYKELRTLRVKLHNGNKPITGLALAGTLDKYSERGQAYIDGIRSMIRYNKLQNIDDAYLSDTILIKLITPK